MDEFFETNHYDEPTGWQHASPAAIDPDDDDDDSEEGDDGEEEPVT